MLVLSSVAAEEANRLKGQAITTEPVALTEEILARVTSIDGAVLMSPEGECFAFGVILDGQAVSAGDPSRGARYNSAVKYLAGAHAPTAIVIVSEDGMIDVLPRLMPRISRMEPARALDELREISQRADFEPEAFYRVWDAIVALRFYLSAEQCEEANQLSGDFEARRSREANMAIRPAKLTPTPEMNDSYFLD